MTSWPKIVIPIVVAVIGGLIAFIVRRELGRNGQEISALQASFAALQGDVRKSLGAMRLELQTIRSAADERYLTRDLFDRLEKARKEVEAERRDSETRLGDKIDNLMERLGGGRGKVGHR
jgi:hypothetical protein